MSISAKGQGYIYSIKKRSNYLPERQFNCSVCLNLVFKLNPAHPAHTGVYKCHPKP